MRCTSTACNVFDTVFNGLATQYSEMAVEHFILLDKLMF
jgi:hypothetical protein